MARAFVAASAQHLTKSGAPITATPLTLACWMRPNSPASNATFFALQNASTSHGWLLRLDAASHVRAQEYDGTTSDSVSAGAITDGVWTHVAGTFNGITNFVFLNGTKATGAAARTAPVSVNAVDIGREATGAFYWNGDIAEAAAWNAVLDDAENAALAAGFSPLLIRPASLIAYWQLNGQYAPEIDLVGRNELTVTGATAAAHCRVIAPAAPLVVTKTTVVYHIAGVTKTGGGVALGSCVVKLFRSSDDALLATTTSDGDGNYSFAVSNPATEHYIVAYKAGSPDLAGTTVNTLVGA